jgi:hypothetical protein
MINLDLDHARPKKKQKSYSIPKIEMIKPPT